MMTFVVPNGRRAARYVGRNVTPFLTATPSTFPSSSPPLDPPRPNKSCGPLDPVPVFRQHDPVDQGTLRREADDLRRAMQRVPACTQRPRRRVTVFAEEVQRVRRVFHGAVVPLLHVHAGQVQTGLSQRKDAIFWHGGRGGGVHFFHFVLQRREREALPEDVFDVERVFVIRALAQSQPVEVVSHRLSDHRRVRRQKAAHRVDHRVQRVRVRNVLR
mmetsp:Transcript_48220/g.94212  ORF Transcript_48220/g.94212 Transcript_48220/m.94212 type:complete len:216 (+) Transcript_48220:348-995(+)